ncbi:uncharacterized protein LOC126823473 isoform X1 [Patella vulgata]|uniref:uncharacterized protein LOC126823473 isoform X1 n=1 Tax=Patella vulgata TaxID=6465 RepID=UPI00217F3112|nr:uncharacterized protein LOC126823473 isoform X1 [Patella vulgata]
MDEINDGHHFNTTEFMKYLVKNLQVLCHGHVPFTQNLEVIGHIYIKVDCSAKFNCFLNEVVSKTDSCETLFTSNSFQAQSQTKNNNRTVINNLKTDVEKRFKDSPSATECRSTKEYVCMPVLLTDETAGHPSVSPKENTCLLEENAQNTSKMSPAENTLNLETAKTCNSLPSTITCRSSSDNGNVCNSPSLGLTNETTHISPLPTEANISNPTRYGNIWNSLSIVNSSPSTQDDNKESWDPSVVTTQNTPSSSSWSLSKKGMVGTIKEDDVQYTPPTTKENTLTMPTDSSVMQNSSIYDDFSPKIIDIRSAGQNSDKDTAISITDLQTTGILSKNPKHCTFVIKNGPLLETNLSPLNTWNNSTPSVLNSPSTAQVNSCNVSSSGSNRLSSSEEHMHTSSTLTKEIIPDVEDIKINNANKWNVITSSGYEQISPKIVDIRSDLPNDANSLNIPYDLDKGYAPVINVIEHNVSSSANRGEEDPKTTSHSPVPLHTAASESLRCLRSSHKQTVDRPNKMKSPGRTGIIPNYNSPVTSEKSRCSVKDESDKSLNNNSTVVKFAKSDDPILQYKKEFKTETIQTSDSANDDIVEQTLSDSINLKHNIEALHYTEGQTLSDSINLLHNIETLHKAEEHALSGSINLLHKIKPEEYTLSDSINLLHNVETPHDTEEQTLSDSINLLHNIETPHDTEEETLSDSINLHNIETPHEAEEQTLGDSISSRHITETPREAGEHTLSDSINLVHNTETPYETDEHTLSDSINLLHKIGTPHKANEHTFGDLINLIHNTETPHEAEEHTLSDSTNLLHNIETLHEVEESSNIIQENINKLDRISKELSFIHDDDDSVDDPCYKATTSSDEYCDSDDSQINRLTRKRKRLSKPTNGKALLSQNKKMKARNRMPASNRKAMAESSTIPTVQSATESIKDGPVIPTETCSKTPVSENSVKSIPKKSSTKTKRKKKMAFHETPDTDTRRYASINNGHRASYCASDKLKIILYADFHGNRAAGRKYGIAESNVRRWKQAREELLAMGPNKLSNRRCPPYYPTIEKQLAEWVQSKQESGVYPSISEICSNALVIAEGQNCGRGPFKASYSWATRFLDRHKLRKNIRRYKKISQDSANDGEEEDLGNATEDLNDSFYGDEDLEASMKEIMKILNDDDEDVEFDGFTEEDLS